MPKTDQSVLSTLADTLTIDAFDQFRSAAHRAELPLAVINAFAAYKTAVDFALLATNADHPEAVKLVGWAFSPESVSILPEFIARQEPRDKAHIRSLAQVVRNGQPLDPILVWRDPDNGSNSVVLLDGAYRLSAYETARWQGSVPARIVECSRSDALLLAAGANSKDRKGLTPREKQDFAWRLVRDPDVKCSRSALAKATGVSEASIARMRRRWKELAVRPDFVPTGVWFRDQADRAEDGGSPAELTDAARDAAIADYVGKLRDLMDWRKGHPILRDEQARFAIVAGAFGHPTDQALAEWILGGEDEANEWMTGEVIPKGDYNHLTKFDDAQDEDYEVNPDF